MADFEAQQATVQNAILDVIPYFAHKRDESLPPSRRRRSRRGYAVIADGDGGSSGRGRLGRSGSDYRGSGGDYGSLQDLSGWHASTEPAEGSASINALPAANRPTFYPTVERCVGWGFCRVCAFSRHPHARVYLNPIIILCLQCFPPVSHLMTMRRTPTRRRQTRQTLPCVVFASWSRRRCASPGPPATTACATRALRTPFKQFWMPTRYLSRAERGGVGWVDGDGSGSVPWVGC